MLHLVHRYLREHGFSATARRLEKEAGNILVFDVEHFTSEIQNGNFDEAVDYVVSYVNPHENLIALNIVFELRKQQFMELLRDPKESTCPRKFFVEKIKPLILINRKVSKEANRGLDKTYDLIHNFSDLLVMSREEQKEMSCLCGSIRSQRRIISEMLVKLLDNASLGLKFEYNVELKEQHLQVSGGNKGGQSSRQGETSEGQTRQKGTARKGVKRNYPTPSPELQKRSGGENKGMLDKFERLSRIQSKSSVAALAFHPKDPNILLLGTFTGHIQLLDVETGSEQAFYRIGPGTTSSNDNDHLITKIQWDPSGNCAALTGASPAIYVASFKKRNSSFKISGIRQIGKSSGDFDPREIPNDVVFLPDPQKKRNHLLCASDKSLSHHGYLEISSGLFVDFKSPRETGYPSQSETCVSLAVVPLSRMGKVVVYGATMMGDILMWNPVESKPIKKLFKGGLTTLLGLSRMLVVERWVLVPIDDDERREKHPKSGTSDVTSEISSKGDVRLFACLQELENGERNLWDVAINVDADGNFKMAATPPIKYPCVLNPAIEPPDWVVSSRLAILSSLSGTKAHVLGSSRTYDVPIWQPKKQKGINQQPSVMRVAIDPEENRLCISGARTVNVYKIRYR